MFLRTFFRDRVWLCLPWALLTTVATLRADTLTLSSGGVVRGRQIALQSEGGSKTFTVETPIGSRITVDREDVAHVKRTPAPALRKSSHGGGRPKAELLTAAQQAWIARVRTLVARLYSEDVSRSRKARAELLAIDDTDAIPALTRTMQGHAFDDARRLFVTILRNLPGKDRTSLLVLQSLYDPSPGIRVLAREAIGPERADPARKLYIAGLRTGSLELAGRAALGIQEIGDPRGESVPFLIDALVYERSQELVTLHNPGESSRFECSTELLESLQPKYSTVTLLEGRPEVLQALLKIVDQPSPMFGYNVDRWRLWWADEVKRRSIKNSSSSTADIAKKQSAN